MAAFVLMVALVPNSKVFADSKGPGVYYLTQSYPAQSARFYGTGEFTLKIYNEDGTLVFTRNVTLRPVTVTQLPNISGVRYYQYIIPSDSTVTNNNFYVSVDGTGGYQSTQNLSTVNPVPGLDMEPPSTPTGLTGTEGDTKVDLRWNANSESDLSHYNVYVDGTFRASVSTTTSTVTGLTNDREYSFTVAAVDKDGLESGKSEAITLTPKGPPPPPPPDTTPPKVPTLSGKAGRSQAVLNWTKSTDADLAGYKLYQDNDFVGTYTTNTATISGLKNGTEYSFQVTAFDKSGNESAKSNKILITPMDKLDVNLIPNGDSIVVQISNGSAPYKIDWGIAIKTVEQSQYLIQNLQYNTDYTVTVTDANGVVFTQTINTGDTKGFVPPTFPSPQEMFQKMLDVFGTAGTIGVAVIGGAIALGIMCVLAMWAWRLLKRWLAKAK